MTSVDELKKEISSLFGLDGSYKPCLGLNREDDLGDTTFDPAWFSEDCEKLFRPVDNKSETACAKCNFGQKAVTPATKFSSHPDPKLASRVTTSLQPFLNGMTFMKQCQSLQVVPVHLTGWVVLLRRGFDLNFKGQPLVAVQLILKPATGRFYVTVFSNVRPATTSRDLS